MSQALTTHPGETAVVDSQYLLSPQQIHFFETFGFLKIPGLFADDIDDIIGGFEDLFGDEDQPVWETKEALHGDERRVIIPGFIEQSPRLAPLQNDPRVLGIVQSILGRDYIWSSSDGNLFYCESYWHPDDYAAPLHHYHVKLSFYLDDLTGKSGAIRIIPGSHFHQQTYSRTLRRAFKDEAGVNELYGIPGGEIPSITVESTPGDLIIWNFRTIHGSYNGGERRRLFSLNFGEAVPGDHDANQIPDKPVRMRNPLGD
jgi:ectoine hydroxylase-related dioxygenase (phytanoyl-CoA dioxygenase family)